MPIYPDGGFATVDVEDVAQGAILAMENGRERERYLLSGENISVKELLDLAAEFAGIKPPRVKVPVPVLKVLAVLMEISSKLTGRRPQLTRSAVDEFAGKYAYADCSKAKRELGFTYRPARETVCRTVAWLLEHGFVPERRRRALTPHPSLRGTY
jgi:dihydroflavonol-4-reductase